MNDISTKDKEIDNIDIKWKYSIGEILTNEKSSLKILSMEIRKIQIYRKQSEKHYVYREKYYQYECLECGYTDWKSENNLKSRNCGCCSGKIPVKGINTLGDLRPDLIKYFENPEDAFKITISVKNKQNLICPICKTKKQMTMDHLVNRGFSCSRCSDNISYPEKFMMSLLNQLNIKYIYQLSRKNFEWCQNFKYDFYLPDYNCIIETNGAQHYGKVFNSKQLYDETLSNDLAKKANAIYHGVDFYEWVDCSVSSPEFIAAEISQTKLCNILNFTIDQINLDKCDLDASKSIMKEICDYYSRHQNIDFSAMENVFQLSRPTIREYLKRGGKLSLCDYSVQKSIELKRTKLIDRISKPVEIFDDANNSIGVCQSAISTEKFLLNSLKIKLHPVTIRNMCRSQRTKPCKGYTFKYITKEEYESRPQDQRDLPEEEI